ncbi:MAG TPA: 3-hydroxyacyl-CoA dehydrogenase family protein, partial [bacterium]|nr:3-hydroxyacyl-CoA dehydrogenase family protein [bacterium]
MPTDIKRVGVVGAGAMGAQIAALVAGAGCDVELLDVVPGDLGPSEDSRSRDRLASSAVSRLLKMKPAPLYCGKDASRIRPGNIEDHVRRLSSCSWIIEAVVERADIKRRIYSLVGEEMSGDAILSSNTSGLLRKSLVEGMNRKTRERFLVTHFFNPPRYMKLLEVVSGDADPSAAEEVCRFAQGKLGKGVVYANDTPLFIANRIGVFYALDTIHRLVEEGWPIEAVDAVLSKPTARPKSGVFRTVDMAGVDILTFVAAELVKGCQNDPDIGRCRIPQFLQQMVVKGLVGDKSEGGFYRKDRLSGRILALDPNTLEYRPKVNFSTPSLVEASRIGDPAERLRRVVFADDQAGEIAWPVVSQTMIYAAMRIPEIADGPVPIDSAMRWGYNWELGPFETWDALGVPEVAKRLEREGRPVPPVVEALLKAGHTHFYEWRGHRRTVLDVAKNSHLPVAGADRVVSLKRLKAVGRLVERNAGASVVDAG